MDGLYLDLRNKRRCIDFLVENLPYLSERDRPEYERLIREYEEGVHLPTDKLAAATRDLATATWPARTALERHFSKEGISEEWRMTEAGVRPATAHALGKLRKVAGVHTLKEALAVEPYDGGLDEELRHEVMGVQVHVRLEYWKSKHTALAAYVKSGTTELKGIQSRLKVLRALAIEMPSMLQNEVFSKISRSEDQVLFEGKIVPLEILDQEIQYYREQKELSPIE